MILGDFEQPGDVAAAKRLDVSDDLVQCQHHVLETAYESLAPSRQALCAAGEASVVKIALIRREFRPGGGGGVVFGHLVGSGLLAAGL